MSKDLEFRLGLAAPQELRRLVPLELRRSLADLLGGLASDEGTWLAKCAVAHHGTALLEEPAARKALLTTVPEEELAAISHDILGRAYAKPDDNATALSRLPWARDSALVARLTREFEIPDAYLPPVEDPPSTVEQLLPIAPLGDLLPHQLELFGEIRGLLLAPSGRALLQMPTGSGKTRTVAEAIASAFGANGLELRSLVWLAPSEELCEQAVGTLSRVWEHRASSPTRLVRFWGQHSPPPYVSSGSIVVSSLQKAHSQLQRDSSFLHALRETARVVIIDEAHRALARTFKTVIESLSVGATTVLGVSATPGRGLHREQENAELADLFGGRLIQNADPETLIERLQDQAIMPVVHHDTIQTGFGDRAPHSFSAASGDLPDLPSPILTRLAKDGRRNRALVEVIGHHVALGRPTLVFACTVEHSRLLAAALSLSHIRSASIDGSMSSWSRRDTIARFSAGKLDVLTNYGILSTGFDAPRIRTVVISRPTTSVVLYSQMIGRVLRGPNVGGGKEAWIIDVDDNLDRFGGPFANLRAFEDFW